MGGKKTTSNKLLVAYGGKKPPKAFLHALKQTLHSDCVTVKAASPAMVEKAVRKENPSRVIIYEDPAPGGSVVRERAAEILKKKAQRKSEDEGLPVVDEPAAIATLASEFQVSMEALARILGVSARTLARWTSGETHKPHPAQAERIGKTLELRNHMANVMKRSAFGKYLHGRNDLLGGMRPLDLLMAGQFDRVIADIAGLEEGVFA
ncbi:MAG TPA: antitoxin Xre-like helix-turn-helix domain-containing protein [Candidatus Deferrimicrobiaceae bacterium]|nr:antitoxin Xre-like helix-turn-helix domain-containing protein [Candidatus Deferrimicrobiaceae bacterium]